MNSQSQSTAREATDYVAVALAATGGVLIILSAIYLHTVINSAVYSAVGIVVFNGCLGYLLIGGAFVTGVQGQAEAVTQTCLLANILFSCAVTYSIRAQSLALGSQTLGGHHGS